MAARMGNPFGTSADVQVVGFPYNGGQPVRPLTPVDGLGALAGGYPLALRFHCDALLLQPGLNRTTNLFGDRNPIALANLLQTFEQFGFQSKVCRPQWRHTPSVSTRKYMSTRLWNWSVVYRYFAGSG